MTERIWFAPPAVDRTRARDHAWTGVRRLAAGAWTSLAVAALLAGSVTAASPTPEPATDTNIEIWLDAAVSPPDARPGASLEIGFTLWDRRQHAFAELNDPYVLLHPAKGKAKPTEGKAQSDWPGHIVATVAVPKGGPGVIEAGASGRSCPSGGTCTDSRLPFAFGGIGPPPDAPFARLVIPNVNLPAGPYRVGQTLDLRVELVPRALWDIGLLPMPDRLVVLINEPRGPDLSSSELHALAQEPGAYTGQVAIPAAGDLALSVAIPGTNGVPDEVIEATRLTVLDAAADVAAGAPAAVAVPAGDGLPLPLIGGAIILVVAAGLGIRRAFADL